MHKHHIIPRHMGGTNDPSNIVELTVEEHALAHKELYEKYGNWQDKIAWQMLSGQIKSDNARRELCRARMLNDNPMNDPEIVKKAMKNRSWYRPTEETKRKVSASLKGKKKLNTENMGKHNIKTYVITYPNGDEITIRNLSKFCTENNLTESLMYKVASGNRNHHKGFKCRYVLHHVDKAQ